MIGGRVGEVDDVESTRGNGFKTNDWAEGAWIILLQMQRATSQEGRASLGGEAGETGRTHTRPQQEQKRAGNCDGTLGMGAGI